MKKVLIGIIPAVIIAFILVYRPHSSSNNRVNPVEEFDSSSFQSQIKDADTSNLLIVKEDISKLKTEEINEPNENAEREVKNGDKIRVNYRGWLASSGEMFDQSFNRGDGGFSFIVGGNVIEGWNEGVIGMKEGEVRRLFIPSEKGYGEAGSGSIPGNADLIFDVELIRFEN